MKYLVILLMLASCSSPVRFKVGECIRVATSYRVIDLYIREIIGDKYVVSPALIYKGTPSYLKKRFVFTFNAIHEDTDTIKIDCAEVE